MKEVMILFTGVVLLCLVIPWIFRYWDWVLHRH